MCSPFRLLSRYFMTLLLLFMVCFIIFSIIHVKNLLMFFRSCFVFRNLSEFLTSFSNLFFIYF